MADPTDEERVAALATITTAAITLVKLEVCNIEINTEIINAVKLLSGVEYTTVVESITERN